jgi:protein disulfide-isomerase
MKFNNRFSLIRLTLVLTAFVACFNLSSANETAAWQTDYKQALAQAAKEHKQILLDFTGSDWCPFCIQMDREVLEKPEFMKYADQNLILVKLDFPRKKQLPTEEIAQNRALQKQYSIDGYPTYVLLNSAGKEVNRQEGALDGGPSAFIGWARAKK